MRNTLRIKIEHVNPYSLDDPRQAFWEPFIDKNRQTAKEFSRRLVLSRNIDSFEYGVKYQLGARLSTLLVDHFGRGAGMPVGEHIRGNSPNNYDYNPAIIEALLKATSASQIVINTTDIRYGSLTIAAVIEPFEKLFDLFDKNFDLMRLFFESYIPIAFLDAIYDPPIHESYGAIPLTYKYEWAEERIPNKEAPTVKSRRESSIKLQWLAGLISSPMLFPFLVALVILYVKYFHFDQEHKELIDQTNIILQQKNELLENYKDLLRIERERDSFRNISIQSK